MSIECKMIPPDADAFVSDARFKVENNGTLVVKYGGFTPIRGKLPKPYELPNYNSELLNRVAQRKPGTKGKSSVILGSGTGLITSRLEYFAYIAGDDGSLAKKFNHKYGQLNECTDAVLSVYRDLGGGTRLCGDTLNGIRQYLDPIKAAVLELCEILIFDPFDPKKRWVIPSLQGTYETLQAFYNYLVVHSWCLIEGIDIDDREAWSQRITPYRRVCIKTMHYRNTAGLDLAYYNNAFVDTTATDRTFKCLITVVPENATCDEIIPAYIIPDGPVALRDSEQMDGQFLNRYPCLYLNTLAVEMKAAPWTTLHFYLDPVHGGLDTKIGGSEVLRGSPQLNPKLQRLLDFAGFDTTYRR